jgi:hypothetical protein
MSEKDKAKIQEFRPKDLARIITQVPAEDIADMAKATIKDELGLGTTPENKDGRAKQIRDAKQTIKDVRGDSHETKK